MNKKPVTIRELTFIRENYEHMTARDIANALNISRKRVRNICHTYKIYLPDELVEERKRLNQFPKGNIPHNTGTKGKMKPNCTSFQSGQLPHNTKTDGTISVRTDKQGKSYQFIRLAQSKWVPLHRYLWEQANGPIPAGHIVVFRDRDTMNCQLSNLELITRAQQVVRNNNPEKRAQSFKRHILRVALIKSNGHQPTFSKYRLGVERAQEIANEFRLQQDEPLQGIHENN